MLVTSNEEGRALSTNGAGAASFSKRSNLPRSGEAHTLVDIHVRHPGDLDE